MADLDTEQIKKDCMAVSPLINEVTFCSCVEKCDRPTMYVKHQGSKASDYHCVIVSRDGLMVNSNGYHSLDVHDAMNEAVKVVRQHLGV